MGAGFKVPAGTPVFQQGFRDGCSQLFYSRGNGYYRWKHNYNYDLKMMRNNEYALGHKRGISFCFNFIVPGVTAADRMLFPNFPRAGGGSDNFLAMSYENTGAFDNNGLSIFDIESGGGLNEAFRVFSGSGTSSAFGANPFWAGGSSGQIFGQ